MRMVVIGEPGKLNTIRTRFRSLGVQFVVEDEAPSISEEGVSSQNSDSEESEEESFEEGNEAEEVSTPAKKRKRNK